MLGGLAVLLSVAVVAGLLSQGPWKYYVEPPTDRAQREALVAKLSQELAHWRELAAKEKDGGDIARDPDRQWPLERLPMVLAIENHYLQKGSFPESIESLTQAGLLADPSPAGRFRIVLKKNGWELHTTAHDFITAVGN